MAGCGSVVWVIARHPNNGSPAAALIRCWLVTTGLVDVHLAVVIPAQPDGWLCGVTAAASDRT